MSAVEATALPAVTAAARTCGSRRITRSAHDRIPSIAGGMPAGRRYSTSAAAAVGCGRPIHPDRHGRDDCTSARSGLVAARVRCPYTVVRATRSSAAICATVCPPPS